jgi:preprotein translocase subunit SecB
MADENQNGAGTAGAAAQGDASNQPQIGIMGQYLKDFSFENPSAPQSLQEMSQNRPDINVNVNLNARKVGDEGYEVVLNITAKAELKEKNITGFVVEISYAGLFGVRNLPQENLEPFLLIECPRLLFPFARRIIADATRDGGFPPLLLDPIDFTALYQKHRAELQAAGGPDGQPATTN